MRPGWIFQFGKFQVDATARTLRREEAVVKLNSRAFDVLLYLVQNPGKILTRDELLKNVWPDTFVDEHNLAQSISVLRRALEEKPGDNSYIVTLPGRGYQFVSAVQVVAFEIVASKDGDILPGAAAEDRSNSSGIIFQKHTVETSVITSREEKEQLTSPISRSRLLLRTVAAVLAVAAVALVLRLRGPWHPDQKHELTQRQLTANPAENSVSSQAISRDGKYLAYRDYTNKLYLLAIDSGEIREMPLPAQYDVDDWFPDGNHLLMESVNGDELWKMSTLDFSLRKLRGGTGEDFAAVSPDGSHIAFVKDVEIWLMGTDGEELHRILASDARELMGLAWSPTGERLAYVRFRGSTAKPEVTLETCDLAGGTRTVVLSDPRLWSASNGETRITWLPDGRIIYPISRDTEAELWAIRADSRTGKPSGDTSRLASWKDFEAQAPQASADGKRLIAVRGHSENWIYVGDLAFGNKGFTPHRVIPEDWVSAVTDWTKDGKAILFHAKRMGRRAIFKRNIEAQTTETLIAGIGELLSAQNERRRKSSIHGDSVPVLLRCR